jgi:hypothetical protein
MGAPREVDDHDVITLPHSERPSETVSIAPISWMVHVQPEAAIRVWSFESGRHSPKLDRAAGHLTDDSSTLARFFFKIFGAHKNTWIKTKVDLSSVPHFGVARDSFTRAVLFAGTARHVSGALKRFVRKGFGQGLANEVLFFCFCLSGRIFVCVLLRCSKYMAPGSV